MAALRQVYRRASLSNAGDRMNLLADPDALEWGISGEMTAGHGSLPPPVAASPAARCRPGSGRGCGCTSTWPAEPAAGSRPRRR